MTSADRSAVPNYPDLLRLDGRNFVVIGAGQGIGRQTTHALAQSGATVFCADIDGDRAKQVADEVSGHTWTGDATDRDGMESLFAAADHAAGPVNGVVDIVGIGNFSSILEYDDSTWDAQFDLNLRHAYLALQVGGRHLAASGGGTMTFIGSTVGIWGAPTMSAYGAAKAALLSLVRSAAVELGPMGIRVNSVSPGSVWTPRLSERLGEEGKLPTAENSPLKRVAMPADVASVLLFLSSDLAGYVNGQTIVCDGGVGWKLQYPMPGRA